MGQAVAGPLQGKTLPLLDESLWMQTTFGAALALCPDALVLSPGQDFERPADWPRLTVDQDTHGAQAAAEVSIAPRWGQNAGLGKD